MPHSRARARAITMVLTATAAAVRRFPLVIAASIAATVGGFATVGSGNDPAALRLLATATLGLPLLLAATILAERRPRNADRWILFALALAALAAFWRAWAGWTVEMRGFRYVQLSAAFHLLAASAPFVGRRGTNAFWQYNKTLFLRTLTAAIYSGVLFAGLAIALAAIDRLFGVHVPGQTYGRLWCLLAFMFSTVFFVGGVPASLEALETQSDYPTGLRAFTQFVLVPLVAIYLVILTLYLVKVVLTQQWPSGWIGYLVSSVAIVGILSWLLVHPLEERPEYGWVKPFTRGFYLALMPAIVMLWLATWQRVQQYGITERRYGLIVLSIWLAIVAAYYTLSRSRNIKLIPASLCVLALVTFAGPTGAYSVSRASQMGRLRTVLERDSLLVGGQLRRAGHDVPEADRIAITAGFRYLIETHGDQSLAAWLSDSARRGLANWTDSNATVYGDRELRGIMSSIGVEPTEPRSTSTSGDSTYVNYFVPLPRAPMRIAGFSSAVDISLSSSLDSARIDERTVVRLSEDAATVVVSRDGSPVLELRLQEPLDTVTPRPRRNTSGGPPTPALRIEAHNGDAAAALYVTQFNGRRYNHRLNPTFVAGELFLRLP